MSGETEKQETQLRAWGIVYAERALQAEPVVRHHRTMSHPIAKSMEFAPGKKAKRVPQSILQGGAARRRLMGQHAGLVSAPRAGEDQGRPLPAPRWAADPVRAKETKPHFGIYSRPVPPDLARIEQAVKALETENLLRGTCIRVNYCIEGQHSDKVPEVNARMRTVSKGFAGIDMNRYRDELLYGRLFIQGWLACKASIAA